MISEDFQIHVFGFTSVNLFQALGIFLLYLFLVS